MYFASLLGDKRSTAVTSRLIVVGAACVSVSLIIWQRRGRRRGRRNKPPCPYTPSPGKTVIPALPAKAIEDLPYPPNALPGGRDVDTPYGSIRVYEWGPEDGDRVLFVHGISTPVVALGRLGHEMVSRGHRVMMFDLFGRGYSDAPNDLTYDSRLYVTQLLLVLASSKLSWLDAPGFRLVGYSLGGGLCVAFARYFPHIVRSLVLVAPGGLIRTHHVGWRSWLYYNSGLLPEFLVRYLVGRRIRPKPNLSGSGFSSVEEGGDVETAESRRPVDGDGDANGGVGFDCASVFKDRPHVTVSSVITWQVDHHPGFVPAFLSTIRNAPIYAPQADWEVLSRTLEIRRPDTVLGNDDDEARMGLEGGRVLFVLGKDDGVIVMDETIHDARTVLGKNAVEFAIIDGGHELPFTCSEDVAKSMERFWDKNNIEDCD
ncbi:alpha/beta-hydrolase [Poronia punctata]|nr:alpha/beta-hydrolase [Poronia punctata]